jgi:enamine deaminase RidA (YjgF/YER057c/UK114 family)
MPKCTDGSVEFGRAGRRVVQASFDGGDIVSDGGVLLLKQLDERLGLTRAAAAALGDDRCGASVQHSMHSLLAQRIYGLCLGWSDVCDHNVLRNDLVMQTAVGRAQPLASAPTLSRLETAATSEHAAALHEVLMQQFIAGHAKPPKELVLDVGATHVPLPGEQERGHFHAYYDNYCYLPLYVFAGQDMLACVLRPSDRDPASVVSALIKRLLQPLRRAWPKTKIIVRADSGFCRPRVLQRLERWGVSYIIGLQKNSRLAQPLLRCRASQAGTGRPMSTQLINPAGLYDGAPIGMSQARVDAASGLVLVSGQVDWDRDARVRHATLEGQAEGAIGHLSTVLDEAGSSLDHVLQLRVYVRGELADAMAQVVPVLARHFGAVRPALTGIGVASLASRDTLIEIEALARVIDRQ